MKVFSRQVRNDNFPIVVGGDHHNALGVIRSLGEAGLKSCLLVVSEDAARPYISYSKYVSSWSVFASSDMLVSHLISIAKNAEGKRTVICCHDGLAAALDARKRELSEYYWLPQCECGDISVLQDKRKMAELAIDCGMDVPSSQGFPVIVKPVSSPLGTKDDIRICNSQEELDAYFEEHSPDNALVQHFVDKVAEYQFIGCRLPDGTTIIPGYSSILRPCKGSNTSFLRYSPVGDKSMTALKCEEFIRRTSYIGLFSVEFVEGKDGQCYFLEVNFRNDGNAICVTASGTNLPLIWHRASMGEDYSNLVNADFKPLYVIPEFEELTLLSHKVISFWDFAADFFKARVCMEFSFVDQGPFWVQLARRIKHKL